MQNLQKWEVSHLNFMQNVLLKKMLCRTYSVLKTSSCMWKSIFLNVITTALKNKGCLKTIIHTKFAEMRTVVRSVFVSHLGLIQNALFKKSM